MDISMTFPEWVEPQQETLFDVSPYTIPEKLLCYNASQRTKSVLFDLVVNRQKEVKKAIKQNLPKGNKHAVNKYMMDLPFVLRWVYENITLDKDDIVELFDTDGYNPDFQDLLMWYEKYLCSFIEIEMHKTSQNHTSTSKLLSTYRDIQLALLNYGWTSNAMITVELHPIFPGIKLQDWQEPIILHLLD